MKKLGIFLLATIAYAQASAQCGNGRYWDELFAVTSDSVLYPPVYNQWMDVYQPVGDTLAARPVIILGHGGSFITGNGDRTNDPTIDSLCLRYAARGYVTVSIDYRTTDAISFLDSANAVTEVIQAISDGKAAIRFFVKDRATTNTYHIDTNNIYVGGNSAGAVLYMHVGYLDSLGECPLNIANAMLANGGFEGNSGNAGYTTRCNAIINLAGALNMTSFIGPGDKPSVNAQGTHDNIVPYYCGYPLSGFVHVNLCGLGALEPVYASNSIYHMSHIFPGDNHVPWSSDNVKLFTVDSMIRIFLYNFVCTGLNEVHTTANNPELQLYPNPATTLLHIRSEAALDDISVFDQMGRRVLAATATGRSDYELPTAGLPPAVYFVKITFQDAALPAAIRKVVME